MTISNENEQIQRIKGDSTPLAIVGIGCVFPRANNPYQYWLNIREGVDAIDDIPASHWNPEDYFDSDKNTPDMTYARRGGFIDPVDFDPLLYGMSPNNIEATDTTQLLGMVVARQALLDAGYSTSKENTDGRAFDRNRTSVILGVTGTLELVIPLGARLGHPHWRRALKEAGVPDDTAEEVVQRIADSYVPWQENSFPGLLGNVAAGRIANRFDLGGTNCVVDAACASSLSAIHMAALELYSGRSDMAITGGFDTFNDIFMYMCFSKTPALSPTGNSRPFDINGDGTILGEGLGAIVLKRLDDARRDGDKVYAILKGMGSSSDGRGNAIYAPSANGQTRALKNAYRDADVRPSSIELVEAHGTGTRVGDAVEAEALSSVYREDQADGTWCAIGSVKSMIGHTKAAAGVAGLIKIAMALKHKVLPPTIKVEQPLQQLDPGQAPIYINTHKRPWLASAQHPRRAALSAFGFGGSNFHCVLEEAEPDKPGIEWDGEVLLFTFSEDSIDALQTTLDSIEPDLSWEELRYQAALSLQTFNHGAEHRLVLAVDHETSLHTLLMDTRRQLAEQPKKSWALPSGVSYGTGHDEVKLAVLFPGQGSQYPNMLLDLSCQFPQLQRSLGDADVLFNDAGIEGQLSKFIFPIPVFTESQRKEQTDRLRDTQHAQPAIGAISVGAYRILEHFGVKADITAGHSFGELTALYAAGRLDAEDMLKLAIKRGELMKTGKEDRGSMLAVSAGADELHEILESEKLDLVIANHNSPRQLVLSGATAQINQAMEILGKHGLSARKLPVSAAFHSRFVADAEQPFLKFMDSIHFHQSRVPVYANATAEPYPEDETRTRELLASQLINPVEFVKQIENIYSAGCNVFLEVGPGNVLCGLVNSILEGREFTALALDQSRGKRSGQYDLAIVLARLAAAGQELNLENWDQGFVEEFQSRSEQKPAMTVSLTGANFVKPRPQRPVKQSISQKPVVTGPAPGLNKGITNTDIPVHTRHTVDATNPDLLQSTQKAILTLQKMQQQTAELHRQYLEGQEAAQQAIQQLLHQNHPELPLGPKLTAALSASQNDTASAISDKPAQTVLPAHEAIIPASSIPSESRDPGLESLLLEVVAEKTGYPQDMLSLDMNLDTDLGIDSIKRVEILSALHESLPDAGNIQPDQLGDFKTLRDIVDLIATGDRQDQTIPQHVIPAAENLPVESILFDVVSEKTGYPVDMLSLDMNLDSDLGIDSIKRVEIFSAMQERMPDLPVINPDELASLQTLLAIVNYMRNADSTAVPRKAVVSDGNPVQTTLMEVVADKTGYPVDMINLDMNLDTDLGIDSIKRVEILSAFQERMPGAPAVSPDELATLQTLQQILDYMQVNTPAHPSHKTPEKIVQKSAATTHTDILLQVVSEKTGYPVEMIKLDMNLDSDLGIDSIKRVEILSAFQEQVPDAPAVNPDDLAALQTLQQIVDNMQGSQDTRPAVKQGQDKIPDEQTGDSIWRGVVKPVVLGQIDKSNSLQLSKDRAVHVIDDGTAVSTAICDELKHRGYKAKKIGMDRGISDDCAGLIIIVPEVINELYPADILQLIQRHADSLKHSKLDDRTLLACVTGMGGKFGIENLCDVDPACASVGGIIKTADKEWPDVVCRVLDIDYSELQTNNLISAIVDELLTEGPLETGLHQGQRYSLDLVPGSINGDPLNPILQQNDLVVISGGARGITASIAIELADQYRTNLLLLGRTALTDMEPDWLQALSKEAEIKRAVLENSPSGLEPKQLQSRYQEILAQREIRSTLEQIEQLGVRVRYENVDIRDPESVNQVLTAARDELGPVRAVIHGAGMLADRLIEDKSRDQFISVYSTKIGGIKSLLHATRDDELKALVLFSSSTARFGRKGQCDYAAANEVLNKIAQQESKQRPACRVLSINWGPWDGGMVTPQLKKLFESEGVSVIPVRAGAQHLLKELSGGQDTEIVILGSPPPADISLRKHETEDMPVPSSDNKMHTAFQRLVSIEEFPVLKSHVMNSRAVLPAALILEWFAHGAMHDNPGLVFRGIDNLKIFKGVILDTDTRMEPQILTGKPVERGVELVVPVELCQGRIRHAAANVILGNDYNTAGEPLPGIRGTGYPQDINEIYIKHRLFHGADLQGLISISDYSKHGISGTARSSPRPSAWMKQPIRTGWLSDPLVVDSAFQLMILWSYETLGAACLPTNVHQYRQYRRSFPKDETIIKIAVISERVHELQAGIEFLDREGSVIARIGDYRAVVDTSLNEAFRENHLLGETQT